MPFDSVCKFIAETFTADLATWLLGEPVELARLELAELLSSPIYADSLVLLESRDLVLQIEFQVEPKAEIPFRMTDYAVRGFRRFPNKRVHQVVIYLRRSQSPLVYQTSFDRDGIHHEFEVIRIWEVPASQFQELPGLLPFAVLAQTGDREQTLQQVSERIEAIGDREQRADVAASTAILAGLVLEKELIRSVLREDVMKESAIYQEIVSTAEERGRSKGLREGKREGKREGELSVVLRQLKHRFGDLSPKLQQKIDSLSLASLEALGEALLDFPSEVDLAAWLQEHR
ncbi:Rpn family recombination-promoting nuclease/putative transposase [Synechococcus sp. PCC 7336]|uniref:Rpn family recombination-promoting nuclease/putative transposase n=1 Tax=Synechococcus sp. PCC 7336 TaxID=195250 RepID=UPI000345DBD2|nr:Rpn family recombination-promoting nuclease/putative transposase [Synechococcus sp. PCC 7336]